MKRKININREKISSEEIAKRRDFGSLMKTYAVVKKPFWKHWSFIAGTSTVLVATVAAVVYLQFNKPQRENNTVKQEVSQTQNSNGDFTYDHSNKDLGHAPFINPPFKSVDIPFAEYDVDADKVTELNYKTGSKIKIPKEAFMDGNGNKIRGKVNVRYREFHDPVDFFVSGIPMTYDSSGMKYTFESAGMVEIYAFQDGKILKVNHDRRIEVKMATLQDGAGYNLYNLDTTAKNWNYIGKDKIVHEKKQEEVLVKEGDPGLTKLKQQQEKTITEEQNRSVSLQGEINNMQQEIKKMEDNKPVEPKKVNPKKKTFNLDIDPKEFPEFSSYKSVVFEVGDENKNFKSDVYTIEWEDIALKEGAAKGSYIITVTKGNDKRNIIAYPVFEGKNYDQQLQQFKTKFGDYTTKLNTRKELEQKKQQEYDQLVLQIKKQQEEYEKQLLELKKKQQEELQKQMQNMKTGDKVFRVFSINSFGVYNCDSPQSYPRGASVEASFVDQNGKPLSTSYTVYLVDREKNALFTYNGNPCANFQFNPSSKSVIWTVTGDNDLAVCMDEQVAGAEKRSGPVNFKMTTYSKDEISSVEKIKSLLKIGEQ